jgi:cyclase
MSKLAVGSDATLPQATLNHPTFPMNRRRFLATAALSLSYLGVSRLPAQSGTAAASRSSMPDGFVELRRGVGLFNGRGGTIGWHSSSDALVAVDAQFPETAQKFLETLPGRDGRKIDALLNTHHHGDHTAGNATFRGAVATIVAQREVPRLQRIAAERQGPQAIEAQVYADTTFAQEWRRDFGSETVTAIYFRPSHTGGDAIVHFEQADVVHLGDLVFNRVYPFIDRAGGAQIAGWISTLEEIYARFSDQTLFIYGHANPAFGVSGHRADLLAARDYLSALLDFTAKAQAEGRALEALLEETNELPGFPDHRLPRPNRLAQNLQAAWEELARQG